MLKIKINKVYYDLEYKDSIVLTDGTVCNGLINHDDLRITISTGGGRRTEREMLDSLLHECVHALQKHSTSQADNMDLPNWVGFYIGRVLYENTHIFKPYLRESNKKRVAAFDRYPSQDMCDTY